MKPSPFRRLWTNEQRADAAKRARVSQPWNYSTGPRTAAGKQTSSRNSYKHGRYSYEKQLLRWYVRLAAMRIKRLDAAISHVEYNYRNELIAKYYPHRAKTPDVMGFYPYFAVHPITAYIEKAKQAKIKRAQLKSDDEIYKYFDSLSKDTPEI